MRPENLEQHEEYVRLQQQLQNILDSSSASPVTFQRKTSLLSRFPLISSFFRGDSEVGNDVSQLGSALTSVQTNSPPPALNDGLQFGGIALAVVDFIRVPFVYLMAFILKEKVPFSLSNNARWGYSALLLALTILSLTVPALAPIIAISAAAATLGFSLFLLGKSLWERTQLIHSLNQCQRKIRMEEDAILLIQEEAKILQVELQKNPPKGSLLELEREISSLHNRLIIHQEDLLSKKTEHQQIQLKISKLGIQKIMDRTMGIAFAAVSLIGVVLALFIPQVSLIMLASISVLSIGYFVGRVTEKFWGYLYSKLNSFLAQPANIKEEERISDTPNYDETTCLMLDGLQTQHPLTKIVDAPIQSASLFKKADSKELCSEIEVDSLSTHLTHHEMNR